MRIIAAICAGLSLVAFIVFSYTGATKDIVAALGFGVFALICINLTPPRNKR